MAAVIAFDSMATLTIRKLDEKTKTRLRVRAAHHGRSMEEEAREILHSALTASPPLKGNLAETIHRRFAAFGGFEFELPRRDAMRQAPGLATDRGWPIWDLRIMIMNDGPATAQTIVADAFFRLSQVVPIANLDVIMQPPGGEASTKTYPPGQHHELAVKNLAPGTTLWVGAKFVVREQFFDQLNRDYKTRMFLRRSLAITSSICCNSQESM